MLTTRDRAEGPGCARLHHNGDQVPGRVEPVAQPGRRSSGAAARARSPVRFPAARPAEDRRRPESAVVPKTAAAPKTSSSRKYRRPQDRRCSGNPVADTKSGTAARRNHASAAVTCRPGTCRPGQPGYPGQRVQLVPPRHPRREPQHQAGFLRRAVGLARVAAARRATAGGDRVEPARPGPAAGDRGYVVDRGGAASAVGAGVPVAAEHAGPRPARRAAIAPLHHDVAQQPHHLRPREDAEVRPVAFVDDRDLPDQHPDGMGERDGVQGLVAGIEDQDTHGDGHLLSR